MPRYKKGELQFYRTSTPKEIKDYLKKHPHLKESIKQFLAEHDYQYRQKTWKKKGV